MKSFRQYIKEEGPANGTGLFGYGFNFQVDTVPTDFDVEDYAEITDDGIRRTKLPWEVENALYANRRRELLDRWFKLASGNNKKVVDPKSVPQVPNWQSRKR